MKYFIKTMMIFLSLKIEGLMGSFGVLLHANEYSATNLQNVRAFLTNEANGFELRHQKYGAINAFMTRRSLTLPALDEIRKSSIQTTQTMFMKTKAFQVGSSLSCNPSGETSGSSIIDLTWNTVTAVIKIGEKGFHNNEVTKQKALANDFYNAEKSLLNQLETNLITYCEANRTGVNALSSLANAYNTWVGGGVDITQVAAANINRFYNLARADMVSNNYNDQIMEIHDPQWTAGQSFYQAQGDANNTNTAFQFEGFDSHMSNAIAPGGYYRHLHYLIPAGGVALADWTDPLNREGEVIGNQYWRTYNSLIMPGLKFQLFETAGCADTTNDGGNAQDLVRNYELSLTYAITKSPLSVANETPIFKYGVLSS